jgi:hypothetical protein
MTDDDGCWNCAFCVPNGPAKETGDCRRYPPVLRQGLPSEPAVWPIVDITSGDWCGEWRATLPA